MSRRASPTSLVANASLRPAKTIRACLRTGHCGSDSASFNMDSVFWPVTCGKAATAAPLANMSPLARPRSIIGQASSIAL
ncbi:MAG: hypothetical protein BWX66_01816 [Deltaproteobacteria bacterium ADurb.Bin058]|nr:MAG: hypothetical protein BWX66_01816 [Deltaproteobacteria bacterium ADurb.Bin058]